MMSSSFPTLPALYTCVCNFNDIAYRDAQVHQALFFKGSILALSGSRGREPSRACLILFASLSLLLSLRQERWRARLCSKSTLSCIDSRHNLNPEEKSRHGIEREKVCSMSVRECVLRRSVARDLAIASLSLQEPTPSRKTLASSRCKRQRPKKPRCRETSRAATCCARPRPHANAPCTTAPPREIQHFRRPSIRCCSCISNDRAVLHLRAPGLPSSRSLLAVLRQRPTLLLSVVCLGTLPRRARGQRRPRT